MIRGLILAAVFLTTLWPALASRQRFKAVDNYLVYYGGVSDDAITAMLDHDLVILHPGRNGSNLDRARVLRLQRGRDGVAGNRDDVLVIAYVSIGEHEQVERGPRQLTPEFNGPVYRTEKNELAFASKGFRNWYLDEIKMLRDKDGNPLWGEDGLPRSEKGQDGLPDENGKWRSYFVNIADPGWQHLLRERMALVTETYGCDGLFLDTVDTASPWGNYGWMQEAMTQGIESIRAWHPETLIIMNRGMFLYEKYGARLARAVDGLMFESFVSEWDWYRHCGVRHRWYGSNLFTLRRDIEAWARPRAEPGVKLFFLHYFDLKQAEAPLYLATLMQDTSGLNAVHAVTSPDLQNVVPPLELKSRPVPAAQKAEWMETAPGTVTLDIESWTKRPDFSPQRLWVRQHKMGGDPATPFIPLIPGYMHLSGSRLSVENLESGVRRIEVRLVDDAGQCLERRVGEIGLVRPLESAPASLEIQVGDGRLDFAWQPVEGSDAYVLDWSTREDLFTEVVQTSSTGVHLAGLNNGDTVFFRLRHSTGSAHSAWSEIHFATPTDCTPPEAPALEEVRVIGNEVHCRWSPSPAKDVAGYYVYFDPAELGPGLPLSFAADRRSCTVEVPREGIYRLMISAFDTHNNESSASSAREIECPSKE